jgi:hypothetical protein
MHDAESKTKKKSTENLNLIRRESPVGSENVENKSPKNLETKSAKNAEAKTPNNVETSNAPKLPPKPGRLFHSFLNGKASVVYKQNTRWRYLSLCKASQKQLTLT